MALMTKTDAKAPRGQRSEMGVVAPSGKESKAG